MAKNIYRTLVIVQRSVKCVDPANKLARMVRVEKDGIYYSPDFLENYCKGSVVDDKSLRKHIRDLETAAEYAMAKDAGCF